MTKHRPPASWSSPRIQLACEPPVHSVEPLLHVFGPLAFPFSLGTISIPNCLPETIPTTNGITQPVLPCTAPRAPNIKRFDRLRIDGLRPNVFEFGVACKPSPLWETQLAGKLEGADEIKVGVLVPDTILEGVNPFFLRRVYRSAGQWDVRVVCRRRGLANRGRGRSRGGSGGGGGCFFVDG